MNQRQQRFVREYLVDLNATAAYVRSGYRATKRHTAEAGSSALMRNHEVAEAIRKAQGSIMSKLEVTAERVLGELAKIGFADTTAAVYVENGRVLVKDTKELTADQRAAIAEIAEATTEHGGSIKVRGHDKVRALELLGKHLRLFTDRIEHSGLDGLADRLAKAQKRVAP